MPVITPTVGRTVHYHPSVGGDGPWPAIITKVTPRTDMFACDVDLSVFPPLPYPVPVMRLTQVPYTETPTPGRWSWPPAAPNTNH